MWFGGGGRTGVHELNETFSFRDFMVGWCVCVCMCVCVCVCVCVRARPAAASWISFRLVSLSLGLFLFRLPAPHAQGRVPVAAVVPSSDRSDAQARDRRNLRLATPALCATLAARSRVGQANEATQFAGPEPGLLLTYARNPPDQRSSWLERKCLALALCVLVLFSEGMTDLRG
jgi:hypothetical protein